MSNHAQQQGFSQAVQRAGLSLAGVAELCGVTEKTVRNWLDGTSPVAKLALDAIQRAGQAGTAEAVVRLRLEVAMAEVALMRIERAADLQRSAVRELHAALDAAQAACGVVNPVEAADGPDGSDAPAG